MTKFPFRNTLAGAMCLGLLGFAASCNRSERSYESPPAANPGAATNPSATPSATNPATTPGATPSANTPGMPGNQVTPPPPTIPAEEPVRGEAAPLGTARTELTSVQMEEARRSLTEIRKVNALEIAAGKVAEERGTNEEIKGYGRQLVEDHEAADRKVVEFATKNNILLTTSAPAAPAAGTAEPGPAPVALDASSKQKVAKLKALKGARFDRGFVTAMQKGHEEALQLLETSKDKVDQPEFDALLTDLQTSVERHLEHAKQLQDTSGGRAANPTTDERALQGRRPVPVPTPEPVPVPDPMRAPDPTAPDPMRAPDPTRPADPTLPTPDPSRTPTPVP